MQLKRKSEHKRNSSVPVAEQAADSTFDVRHIFSALIGLKRVAVAVSGGSDSMAMLRLLNEWALLQSPRIETIVLTVDHGLRNASALEAQQVAQWCAALGISHHKLRWEGDKPITGIQARARQARYDLMSAWCASHQVSALLTGHTADDQAETVMMRQMRTDSAKSLVGIWPEREWNGIRVLRPMLSLRRENLRFYLRDISQNWIDDPSNDDMRFERVRVRQSLAGRLNGFCGDAGVAFATVQKNSVAAKVWCERYFVVHKTGFVTVPRSELELLPPEIGDDVVLRFLRLCGSDPSPERLKRMSLLAWLMAAGCNRRVLGGAVFVKQQNRILVGREPGRINTAPSPIPEAGEIVWDGRFRVVGPVGAAVVPVAVLSKLTRRKDIPAFIQAGLPAVLRENRVLAVPHLGIGANVQCEFIRR
jgi:tRNA(Ile)-lysidine synthase